RIDVAVADAMLERDPPAPTRAMGNRTRKGRRRLDSAGLYRERAVGRKPVRPILEADPKRLADEQRAKAGAIDEQVAIDGNAGFEHQRLDVATLAVLAHVGDLAFDPPHARGFGETAQVSAVQSRIEVISIVERHLLRRAEPAGRGRLVLEAISTNVRR